MQKKIQLHDHSQRGIALLIAIFVLLLISVVAIALLVSSGTETALGANYRSSSTVYYAALAGLEEARGRLLPKNPDALNCSVYPLNCAAPTNLPIGYPIYITNPAAGETFLPWDPTSPYYDSEYLNEFPASDFSNAQTVPSVWQSSSVPGPLYKWVRITAATEYSINADVNYDHTLETSTPLFYNPANIATGGTPWPSLMVPSGPPVPPQVQALEITALAYLPNGTPRGSKKILQYVVAPITANIAFPAAMTLDGYSDSYSGPNHNAFQISGNQDGGDSACGGSTTPYPVPAIAVPDNGDVGNVIAGIPTSPTNETGNYTGTVSTPSVSRVLFSNPPFAGLQTVQSLDQLVQTITQNADAVITGPATQANLPSGMSSGNPMTVVIAGNPAVPSQGNLTLSGGFTGYGLLLVTGNFQYTPDTNWNGIVLVIGQGNASTVSGGSGGTFTGAMLIAQTRDSSGNLLPGPNPGPATFNDSATSSVGRGYFYNCRWILAAEAPLTYKVLSFHEIPQ